MLGKSLAPAFKPVEIERFLAARPAANIRIAVDLQRRFAPVHVDRTVIGTPELADKLVRARRICSFVTKLIILADDDAFAGDALAWPGFEKRILCQLLGNDGFDFEIGQREEL